MATPTTLPAAFVAGNVLTAAQLNDVRGAFRILQVVVGTTSTQAVSSSSAYADTGLTATITPSSSSSKVLVLVMQNSVLKNTGNAGNACNIKLVRGATDLVSVPLIGKTNTDLLNIIGAVPINTLDLPATTSATTYKTQFANDSNTASGAIVQFGGAASAILLLEVSA
jgi:hypothetical protein